MIKMSDNRGKWEPVEEICVWGQCSVGTTTDRETRNSRLVPPPERCRAIRRNATCPFRQSDLVSLLY